MDTPIEDKDFVCQMIIFILRLVPSQTSLGYDILIIINVAGT